MVTHQDFDCKTKKLTQTSTYKKEGNVVTIKIQKFTETSVAGPTGFGKLWIQGSHSLWVHIVIYSGLCVSALSSLLSVIATLSLVISLYLTQNGNFSP